MEQAPKEHEKLSAEETKKFKSVLISLAEAKQQEAAIKEQRQRLEGIANSYFNRLPDAKFRIAQVGTFSRVFRTFYTYSPVVITMEEELKNIKKLEIEKGVAQVKATSKEIRFYAVKE